MTRLPDDTTVLKILEPLALAAGRRIMEVFHAGFKAEAKVDGSPVTTADRDAEGIILQGLRASFPGVAIVAEEEVAAGIAPETVGDTFFLVDALDGTREFVKGGTDFTVNIALIRGSVPAVGVVYAPALNALYTGRPGCAELVSTRADHTALDRKTISARKPQNPSRIVVSRSHMNAETDDFIARQHSAECTPVGASLKFCLVAAGLADLYPRFGRTMQWDTAAGDAVLRAAGGTVRTADGKPFSYGNGTVPGEAPFANPYFIAEGLPA